MDNNDRIAEWKARRAKAASQAAEERKLGKHKLRDLKRQQSRELIERTEVYDAEKALVDVPDLPGVEKAGGLGGFVGGATIRDRIRQLEGRNRTIAIGAALLLSVIYCIFFLSPFYTAHSVVALAKPSGTTASSSAGFFSFGSETVDDAYQIATLVRSRSAQRLLDEELNYTNEFRAKADILSKPRRFFALGIDEYSFYKNRVRARVNIQSGLVTFEVDGTSPEQAEAAAQQLIAMAQNYVDTQQRELTEAQLADAVARFERAETRFTRISEDIQQYQQDGTRVDPIRQSEIAYRRVQELEQSLSRVESQISGLQVSGVNQGARLAQLIGQRDLIRSELGRSRARLSRGDGTLDVAGRETILASLQLQQEIAQQALVASQVNLDEAQRQILASQLILSLVSGPDARPVPDVRRSTTYLIILTAVVTFSFWLVSLMLGGLNIRSLQNDQ